MSRALREHWPEYLLEATALGIFMVSAAVFTTLFEYPYSPVRQAIADAFLRRIFIGLANKRMH
jgi:aquaporin Z